MVLQQCSDCTKLTIGPGVPLSPISPLSPLTASPGSPCVTLHICILSHMTLKSGTDYDFTVPWGLNFSKVPWHHIFHKNSVPNTQDLGAVRTELIFASKNARHSVKEWFKELETARVSWHSFDNRNCHMPTL